MNYNVGALDRALRVLIGGAVIAAAVAIAGEFRWWTLVGLVPLLTGVVGFCPLYTLLGINTFGKRTAHPT